MDLLARREHSARELARKLQRRYPRELVQATINDLADEGLQSDERFAETYVRQRAGRGYGPLRIQRELQERGVDNTLAGSILEGSGFDWQEVAQEALTKKFGPVSAELSLSEKARILRFAAYRGFSQDDLPPSLR